MDTMELKFPAIRGLMGNRTYYVALFPILVLSKVMSPTDWSGLPPEQRAQRALNVKRVPEIARYVLDHEEDWIFSSLTASFDATETFRPIDKDHPEIGEIRLPMTTNFLVNDGQHRLAALLDAAREDPQIGRQTVSVVLFPTEDLQRSQQMFSDLNRTVQKTSRSLDILYDFRDPINQITLTVARNVSIFKNRVEMESVSLPARSAKLVTLSSLYNANERFLGRLSEASLDDKDLMAEKTRLVVRFWNAVTQGISQWQDVINADLRPAEIRAETISFHAVALWGLGGVARLALDREPDDWEERLQMLRNVDWRRVNPEWQGRAMIGSDIINRRQTREVVTQFLAWKVGLTTEEPARVLGELVPSA